MIDYAAHRARRSVEVTGPDGWLAVVEQQLLDEGDNDFPGIGAVRLESGVARVGDLVLAPDAIVPFGGRTLQLVGRAGKFALRLRDPENPARRGFAGIPFYPLAPTWRLPARLIASESPRTLPMTYTIGTTARVPSPGVVAFEVAGKEYRLDAIRLGEGLLAVFGDTTNGRGTYGGGRFLWLEEPVAVADFNLAENPACVFTEHALCPLPSPENRLALAVEAGEKYPGA